MKNNSYKNKPILFKKIAMVSLLTLALLPVFGQQYTNSILNSAAESVCMYGGTYISYGYVDRESVHLKTLPTEVNGYIEFHFSNLNATSDITINLEDITNATHYYEFSFSSNGVKATNHQETAKTTQFPLAGSNRNEVTFRLQRCTNSIAWFMNNELIYQVITKNNEAALQTRMQVNTADEVVLETVFDEGDANCSTCSELSGTNLRPGDLMFLGFDNDNGAQGDRIVMTNLVPLAPGTNFTLAEAAYNDDKQQWYASDGRNDERIGSLSITYVGTTTIPANSRICFDLLSFASFGMADNFFINGVPSSDDFCVENNGFSPIYSIDLATSGRWSIFLMQGKWKFTNAYGLWCGKVLSGLHFGNNWTTLNSAPNTATGNSHIPPDISCLFQFDNGTSNARSFYYQFYATPPSDKQDYLADLIDMNNFTTDPALPNDICEVTIQPFTQATTEQGLTPPVVYVGDLGVRAYPNPFLEDIQLQFQATAATPIHIQLLDATGRLVHQEKLNALAGESTHTIRATQSLSSGLYFIRIQAADNQSTIKLIRVRE